MNEDIIISGMFFCTAIVITLGIPVIRAWVRNRDRVAAQAVDPAVKDRLDRIERAVEAVAIEVERISEGQRFVTRLLGERERSGAVLPPTAT